MKPYIHIILTSLLLASCSLVDEPVENCYDTDSDGNVMLSFRMLTPAVDSRSRADDQNHDEVDSEYLRFEDGIDMSDIGMFVFAKMANAAGNEKLVLKVTDFPTGDGAENVQVSGGAGSYTVNITFGRTQLASLLGRELEPNGAEMVQFRILMVANSSDQAAIATDRLNEITGDTYTAVINQLEPWIYSMSDLCNFNPAVVDQSPLSGMVTDLYPGDRKCMPMFGSNTFRVSQRSLCNSTELGRAYLGEMDMLRSLAKIRLIDNISNKNEAGYPKIISADLVGTQQAIHVLPYGALTYINATQVHTPVIADTDLESENRVNSAYGLGIIPASWTDIPAQSRKGNIFVGYAPEMSIRTTDAQTGEGLPAYRINIALSRKADGTEVTREYIVPMTGYEDNSLNFGDYILRNHIYTLSINSVANSLVTFNVAVKEWRTIDYEYEY